MKLALQISHDHPSEQDLLRFHAGDLQNERYEQIRAHLSSCSGCSAFLQELDSFRKEFYSTHSKQGMLTVVKSRAENKSSGKNFWWRSGIHLNHKLLLGTGLVSVFVIASVLILALFYRDKGPLADSVRTKGSGISLSYLVMENSKPVLAKPGKALHPMDRIQFLLSAPRGGYVHIVGVDEAGVVTVYFPLPGMKPEAYPGGSARPLPGSIILDDTLGKERVFALFCNSPIPRGTLERRVIQSAKDPRTWISKQRLAVDCRQTSILLKKESLP